MNPPARVIDDDGVTARYHYQPDIPPGKIRGPMPSRMARDMVLFLNGIEPPATGGNISGRKRAGKSMNDVF